MRKLLVGLLAVQCAVFIACGGARKQSFSAAPVNTGGAEPGSGDPRAQIDQLDHDIEAELAQMGLPTSEPPSCDGNCGAPTAQAMSAGAEPPTADPTCKPAPSEKCTSSCTLSSSICSNAGKICKLADQLGGGDSYANGKCARGTESCTKSRTLCCGCM